MKKIKVFVSLYCLFQVSVILGQNLNNQVIYLPSRGVWGLQNSDDKYLIARSYEDNIMITNISADYQIIWQKTYGDSNKNEAVCILQNYPNEYLLVTSSDNNTLLVTIDDDGSVLWTKTIPNYPRDARSTYDQCFVLALPERLIKINRLGEIIWEQDSYKLGGYTDLRFENICSTSDSGCLIGTTGDLIPKFIIKYDKDGNHEWMIQYTTFSNIKSIIHVPDSGFGIVQDYTFGFTRYEYSVSLTRTDNLGNGIWTKSIDNLNPSQPKSGQCVNITKNGDLIITGYTSTNYIKYLFLARYNISGENIYYRNFRVDVGRYCFEDNDGQIVVIGDEGSFKTTTLDNPPTEFDIFGPISESEIKATEEILFSWGTSLDFNNDQVYYSLNIYTDRGDTSIHNILETSYCFKAPNYFKNHTTYYWYVEATDRIYTTRSNQTYEFFITRDIDSSDIDISPLTFVLDQNYPNPFNETSIIEFDLPREMFVQLELYNTIGEKVQVLFEGNLPRGRHMKMIDGKYLSSGLYFYVMSNIYPPRIKKCLVIK